MEIASSAAPSAKDAKSSPSPSSAAARSRRRRNICIVASLAAVVLLALLILILALTVFKAKRPITAINSVALADLAVSFDIARPAVDLNVTLIAAVAITNPNKVGFSYSNSTALLNYRGDLVGEAPIPAGRIGAGKSQEMNVTLTIMADRLLRKTAAVIGDVVAGSVPLSTYTRVSGMVKILGIFKIHVVSTTTCDLTIDMSNRTIGDQQCNYRTKI